MHQHALVTVLQRLRDLREYMNKVHLIKPITINVHVLQQIHLHVLSDDENEVTMDEKVHKT